MPEAGPAIDGNAAFLRLLGLVARTRLTLSPDRRPHPHRTCAARPTLDTRGPPRGRSCAPWSRRPASRTLDTTDGVRVVEDDGRWALVLPDPTQAITHLWAEGGTDEEAADLLEEWSAVVGRAGR